MLMDKDRIVRMTSAKVLADLGVDGRDVVLNASEPELSAVPPTCFVAKLFS
jgi:hypothetical protein